MERNSDVSKYSKNQWNWTQFSKRHWERSVTTELESPEVARGKQLRSWDIGLNFFLYRCTQAVLFRRLVISYKFFASLIDKPTFLKIWSITLITPMTRIYLSFWNGVEMDIPSYLLTHNFSINVRRIFSSSSLPFFLAFSPPLFSTPFLTSHCPSVISLRIWVFPYFSIQTTLVSFPLTQQMDYFILHRRNTFG